METDQHFAALWKHDGWRYALPVLGYCALGVACLTGAAAWMFAGGLVGIWPLAAAGGVAIVRFGYQALTRKQAAGIIDSAAPERAAQPLQDIALALFRKAGLAAVPEVRLATNANRRVQRMNRVVGTVPFTIGNATGDAVVPILLGREVPGLLTPEEMTAVLARATAHIMVRPPSAGPLNHLSRAMEMGLLAAGAATLNIPMLAVTVATTLIRHCLAAQADTIDYGLASRNALALFSHRTAHQSAALKVRSRLLEGRRSDFSLIRIKMRALTETLANLVFQNRVHMNSSERDLNDIVAFCTRHDLAADGRDVLTPELKAAWQALRTPHYWEIARVPVPALPAITDTLRREWAVAAAKPDCGVNCLCVKPSASALIHPV